MDFNVNAFDKFDKQWALVTAKTDDGFNTMTVSWGGLGTLWSKPVATVYIKPVRYTYKFMEASEYFTVSFFPPKYKDALLLLGTKSGRDGDKVALAKLTPKEIGHGVTFEQASAVLVCKKIYWQDLTLDNMPADVIEHYYETEQPHRMYVGEVVEIIEDKGAKAKWI